MSLTQKNPDLMIGIALIIGAWFYSRRAAMPAYGTLAKAQQQPQPARGPLGTGSMPGSVGTGIAQQIGGMLGNLLAQQSGGGTSTGAPVTSNAQPLAADDVLQNSITAADPMATFDPTMGSMFA